MRPLSPPRRRASEALGATLAMLIMAACGETDSVKLLSVEAVGTVNAKLVLDANGGGGADQSDPPLVGWTVELAQPAGGTVVSDVTDGDGAIQFADVPVGLMIPSLSENDLGDTLSLISSTVQTFTLEAGQQVTVSPVVTLPFFTLSEARDLPTGKPLFVEGTTLNSFPVTGDRDLHLKSGASYIRVLSVDSGTVAVGDSVRVRGRTSISEGVPVLDGQMVYRLSSAAVAPVPVNLTTGEAAGARGGALDAALVKVATADIIEVIDEGNDGVVLVVDDGTGPLSIRFRAFLDVDPDSIDPDTEDLASGTGLLVPVRVGGAVVWELQPRTIQEVSYTPIVSG
ncbi:MAG: hypothetical protein PVJ04_16930 [Gemmatimonadota bacterium]